MIKRILLIFILLSINLVCKSDEYRVNVKTYLNIRSQPNASSKSIGQLQNNQIVEVIEINNGWAKINYSDKYGYLNSVYLVEIKQTKIIEQSLPIASSWEKQRETQKKILIAILIILCILIIRGSGFAHANFDNLDKFLFAIVCTLELIYYFVLNSGFPPDGDHLWFIHIRSVGFLWAIFNAFLLFMLGIFQLGMIFNYWNSIDIDDEGNIGLWTAIPIVFILYISGVFIIIDKMNGFLAALLVIYGIGQVIQIFRFYNSYNITGTLAKSYLYVVSMSSTALVFTDGPGFISFFIDNVAV